MIRYTAQFKLPGQPKETRTTPFLPSKGHAIYWLSRIKPAILSHLDTLAIKQYQSSDPR